MNLSPYITGWFRDALPPGIFQEDYRLLVDLRTMFHLDPQCTLVRGRLQLQNVPTLEIGAGKECVCLTSTASAPVEFRALARTLRWHQATELGRHSQDKSPGVLYQAWRRAYITLQQQREGQFPTTYPEGSDTLNAYLYQEYQKLEEMEAVLREKYRHLERYQELVEYHQGAEGEDPTPGTYLVAMEGFGLGRMVSLPDLALICLQMPGLNPWENDLVLELDEKTLSLYALICVQEGYDVFEEGRTHVRLEESDTCDIRETARALWDPSDPLMGNISTTLDIARRV